MLDVSVTAGKAPGSRWNRSKHWRQHTKTCSSLSRNTAGELRAFSLSRTTAGELRAFSLSRNTAGELRPELQTWEPNTLPEIKYRKPLKGHLLPQMTLPKEVYLLCSHCSGMSKTTGRTNRTNPIPSLRFSSHCDSNVLCRLVITRLTFWETFWLFSTYP